MSVRQPPARWTHADGAAGGARCLRAQFAVGQLAARNARPGLSQRRRQPKRAKRAASAPRASPTTTARRGSSIVSQTHYEQAHIASALVFELSKVEHLHIREAMVGHLRHIDEDLANAGRRPVSRWTRCPTPPRPPPRAEDGRLARLADHRQDEKDARRDARLASWSRMARTAPPSRRSSKAAIDARRLREDRRSQSGRRQACRWLAAGGRRATGGHAFGAVRRGRRHPLRGRRKMLAKESAAIDFVRDAFGHLKAIAVDDGGQALLKAANVGRGCRRRGCQGQGCIHRRRKDAAMGQGKVGANIGRRLPPKCSDSVRLR